MARNEKYSHKDFTGQSFKDILAEEFNNSEIVGSCFYHEAHEDELEVLKDVFPANVIGMKLINCNLDNVKIPVGAELVGNCCNRRIKVQNDTEDWVLDDNMNPIEPINKKRRLRQGISIDPKDIPKEFIRTSLITKKEWDATYGKNIVPSSSWFKELPIVTEERTKKVTSYINKTVWDSLPADEYMYFDSAPEQIKNKGNNVLEITGYITQYEIQGKGKLSK